MDGGSTPPKSTILCLTNRQFEMEQKKKRNYGKMTAEELSAAVNLVKSENSGVFGVKDIRSAFKDLGVPMYSEFATTLVQQGVLVQAGLTYQDGFSWSNTEPIHINKVVELMTITRKKVPVHERKELVPVDKAIKLLTENGYRVSKPILIYEEVTVK